MTLSTNPLNNNDLHMDSFGAKSLIHILENVDILLNHLFQIKQSPSIDTNSPQTPSVLQETSVSQNREQPKNIGLDILLYMLQNTDKLLQTIIEIGPEKKSLYGLAKSYIDDLKSYDLKKILPEVKLEDPPDISNENLNIGLNRDDYFDSNNVITVAQTDVQDLTNGLNKNPIEKGISQKTEIELIPGKNKEEYNFIVKESPGTKKTPIEKVNLNSGLGRPKAT